MSITVQHTQETLCLCHIYALAGVAGVNFGIDHIHDYGVDGVFTPVTVRGNRRVNSGISLDFQAKATTNWKLQDGHIVYDVEAKTYNDLVSRTIAETSLLLILLCLPKEQGAWHGATHEATTLRNCCYWQLLSGDPTENTGTQRIHIPCENLLTPATLNDLLEMEKRRRLGQIA